MAFLCLILPLTFNFLDKYSLPTLDATHGVQDALLVQVFTQGKSAVFHINLGIPFHQTICLPEIPSGVVTLARCSDDEMLAPSMDSVLSVLVSHGINTQSVHLGDRSADDVKDFLRAQKSPVFILHHSPAVDTERRVLFDLLANGTSTNSTSSNSTVVPLTEQEISQYQVHEKQKQPYLHGV